MRTMSYTDIEKFIKEQLSELLDMDIDKIKNDDNLINYGADSMVIVQLYLSLQEMYNVQLEDKLDLYRNSISIKDIIESVRE